MNVVLTNLSDELYQSSRFRLNESARKFGINNIRSYNFNDIKDSDFYSFHKAILDQSKGLGYWLWKPYIILEAFKQINDGDIVIYSDCGIEIVANLTPLINICNNQNPILLFGNCNEQNITYTKRDCFVLMNCDNEIFWYGPHTDAAFCLYKKSDLAIRFLSDWLKFGSDKRILTDLPNTKGLKDLSSFKEHRWDQSILSLLAQLYKINLFRMPTQFNNHYKTYKWRIENEFNCINQSYPTQVNHYSLIPYYNSDYPQLLNHHRDKEARPTANNVIQEDANAKGKVIQRITRKFFGNTKKAEN